VTLSLIIFNSPINGRQYKTQHRKKRKKAVTTVTKHQLNYTISTQAMTVYYTDLQNALSHDLYLIRKCSLWRARITLGNSKANSFWQFLTVSLLLVLNSFIKNLSMTKFSELADVLFNGQASSPYNNTGTHSLAILQSTSVRELWKYSIFDAVITKRKFLIKYASLANLICYVCQNFANPETAAVSVVWPA